MTIKFFIKHSSNKSGKFKISGRVTINRKKSEFVTDYQVIESDWA